MIPDFANNIEKNANALLNDTEDSIQYWNDPKSDDFHGYMSNMEYRYTIFTFTDEMKVTFGILDRAEEQIKHLENDCDSSGFDSFFNTVSYNLSDNFYSERKNNKKRKAFQKGVDAVRSKEEHPKTPAYSTEQLDEIKNKYVNPQHEAMKRERILKPQIDISKYHHADGQSSVKINVPQFPNDDQIYRWNDGDYDWFIKNSNIIGKRPNRQHYIE
jgi:hypothetical protein